MGNQKFRFVMLALALTSASSAYPQSSSMDVQAKEDFKLTEVEPYYTRYKALLGCVRTMLSNTGGGPDDQAKLILAFCQEKSNDLRALLGAKIGVTRATKVLEVFRGELIGVLEKQEEAAAQAKLSPDERLAKQSFWSSGAWHVLKASGRCVALHRFQGSTTFGGLSFAGGTLQDVLIGDVDNEPRVLLFTPSAGHAEDMAPYAGKTVKLTISAQKIVGGRDQLDISNVKGVKEGSTYYLNLGSLGEFESVLPKYKTMTFVAVDGNGPSFITDYSYDLTGIAEAIAAYRKCAS